MKYFIVLVFHRISDSKEILPSHHSRLLCVQLKFKEQLIPVIFTTKIVSTLCQLRCQISDGYTVKHPLSDMPILDQRALDQQNMGILQRVT